VVGGLCSYVCKNFEFGPFFCVVEGQRLILREGFKSVAGLEVGVGNMVHSKMSLF